MPELTIVVSEIRPILSPKHDPPAMAPMVRAMFPPTMWLSQRKMGAHAAKVPQEVPVAIDSTAVTIKATTARTFALSPAASDMLITEAATPVAMKHSATA
ncbi:hypothetical protein SDC9_140028 [bioreactor metagenome]|uniref:Uncharacterized protein n=1 Tax=bioreactor metagenome TaxID=1076179 RepID=A0A645DX29_9ZZZZ